MIFFMEFLVHAGIFVLEDLDLVLKEGVHLEVEVEAV